MLAYDTLSRKEKNLEFDPGTVVKVFVCGPTVQDTFHLGHARTYTFFDSVVKYLRVKGYSVFYLQNITDIDDKIIKRANEENVPYDVISKRYSEEYMDIMKTLKIDSVNFYAKATSHISEIVQQIRILIDKGLAYETSDGVYFSVAKFPDYGKLSGQDPESLRAGARVESTEEKHDPRDFVIWKKMKPGEPYWESPWGRGRPGWHIEDTAITEKYFGTTYDIHGGGTDLIFPHHEAEIALERSISGQPFLARYWLHSAMLNVNEEKMSKSLKNYITIRSVLKDYLPEELRYALLNVQFRTTVSFSPELMTEARANISTINTIYRKLKLKNISSRKLNENPAIAKLSERMDSNFDFRLLFRDFLEYIGKWNTHLDNLEDLEIAIAIDTIEWLDSFTGIIPEKKGDSTSEALVGLLLKMRRTMREKKDFAGADEIRKNLREMGITIEDRGEETIWWKD